MTKYLAAFVSVLLLLGTPAIAASWSDGFKACDADGNSSISRGEFTACEVEGGRSHHEPDLYDDGQGLGQQSRHG